jgi:hypothetical protein
MARVLHHSRAVGTAKVVLLGIANHVGRDRDAWPTVATLSRYANVDPRTVQRALTQLCRSGDLVRLQQQGGTDDLADHQRPNRYRLGPATDCPANCDGTTNHRQRALPRAPADLWTDRVTPTSPGDVNAAGEVTSASPEGDDVGVTQTVSCKPSVTTAYRSVTDSRARDAIRCSTCGRTEPECRKRSRTSGHAFDPAFFP